MGLEIIKELKVDFYDSRYISINTKQYDKSSRYILVTCYNRGTIFPIDNVCNFAFVRYRKPDDKNVFNCCDITEDGKVLIELTEQMLAFAGKCFIDLVIVNNEPISVDSIQINNGELLTNENTSIVSTMLFCVNVIEAALDNDDIESTDEFNALNELLIKVTTDYSYVMKAAKISEENAKISETNAKTSEENAYASEINAKTSESNAKVSEENASTSETNAKASEVNASVYEANAKISEENAKISEANAKASEEKAATSETNAKASEENAESNANIAMEKASESLNSAILSQSYAVGGTNTRIGEDTDNSKYYCTQAKAIKDSVDGSFRPNGTIEFSELKSVIKESGYVYHISDSFITDDTFKCGAGVSYPAGTNVYYTIDGYWDCFVGENLVITDDGDGNVEIICTYDFITTYESDISTNQIIIDLQKRIKELEDQVVIGITE